MATHVKLWKSLKEHWKFKALLKRWGSDDNNTSTEEGVSPLKHVGALTRLVKLNTMETSHKEFAKFISKLMSLMTNQWVDSFSSDWQMSVKMISKIRSLTWGGGGGGGGLYNETRNHFSAWCSLVSITIISIPCDVSGSSRSYLRLWGISERK